MYGIWKERNRRVFHRKSLAAADLISCVYDELRASLSSWRHARKTDENRLICLAWNISFVVFSWFLEFSFYIAFKGMPRSFCNWCVLFKLPKKKISEFLLVELKHLTLIFSATFSNDWLPQFSLHIGTHANTVAPTTWQIVQPTPCRGVMY